MKLATRLAAGYALVIAVMAGMGAYQLALIDQLLATNRQLSQVSLTAVSSVLRLRRGVEQIRELTGELFVAPRPRLRLDARRAARAGRAGGQAAWPPSTSPAPNGWRWIAWGGCGRPTAQLAEAAEGQAVAIARRNGELPPRRLQTPPSAPVGAAARRGTAGGAGEHPGAGRRQTSRRAERGALGLDRRHRGRRRSARWWCRS